jgi:hypothetical protein
MEAATAAVVMPVKKAVQGVVALFVLHPRIVHSLVLAFHATYVLFTTQVLQMLYCEEMASPISSSDAAPGGDATEEDSRLVVQPIQVCYDSSHAPVAALAWLFLFLYCIGVPVLLYRELRNCDRNAVFGVIAAGGHGGGHAHSSSTVPSFGVSSSHLQLTHWDSSAALDSTGGGAGGLESYSHHTDDDPNVTRARFSFLIRDVRPRFWWFRLTDYLVGFVVAVQSAVAATNLELGIIFAMIAFAIDFVFVLLLRPLVSDGMNLRLLAIGLAKMASCTALLFYTGDTLFGALALSLAVALGVSAVVISRQRTFVELQRKRTMTVAITELATKPNRHALQQHTGEKAAAQHADATHE